MSFEISCRRCGQDYPGIGFPYCCPACGGLFEIKSPSLLDNKRVDVTHPGIWRYQHTFGLPSEQDDFSLGEGNTPLIWAEIFGRRVAFKCEHANPTGSFKDRGTALIVAWLASRGISEVIEDSSGNAGASLAAYAARAGIRTRIFVPESASGPKRKQIAAYGAELVPIPGSRSDVSRAVKTEADLGSAYASHAYLPFNIPGYATAAYEIFEQLNGSMPGTIIVPVGQGGFLLGLVYGFNLLRIAENVNKTPKLIGVQASACAPIMNVLKMGSVDYGMDGATIAEGIRVSQPLRIDDVVASIKQSRGDIHVVDDDSIRKGRDRLAELGFYVEPTSAVVWSVLEKKLQDLPDPVVVLLTGSGYKYG